MANLSCLTPDLHAFPHPRQHDAKNQTRRANCARADKEHSVGIHQRMAMMREIFDQSSGRTFQDFSKPYVSRRQERVLRCCVADAGQAPTTAKAQAKSSTARIALKVTMSGP